MARGVDWTFWAPNLVCSHVSAYFRFVARATVFLGSRSMPWKLMGLAWGRSQLPTVAFVGVSGSGAWSVVVIRCRMERHF